MFPDLVGMHSEAPLHRALAKLHEATRVDE